jgi:hypothetical protein
MTTEREPIVIELKDGETVGIILRSQDRLARCKAEACLYHGAGPRFIVALPDIVNEGGYRAHHIAAEPDPDPIRAAELAERERCKAAVRQTLSGKWGSGKADIDAVLAAIDAEPEEVSEASEYEMGAAAMKQRCWAVANWHRNKQISEGDYPGGSACRDVADEIKALSLTEPPDA